MPKRLPKKALSRRRTRRGRRGRRRSRRGSSMHYVEVLPISLAVGTNKALKYELLVNRPKSMNFRVQYVHFVGTAAYDTASNSFHPSALQIQMNSPYDGAFVANTGPVVLGTVPRNVKIHNPRSSDWVAWNQDNSDTFATIEAVCIGKDNTATCFVRGIIHVLVRFSAEMVGAVCPKLDLLMNRLLESTSDPDDDDRSEIQILENRIAALKSRSSTSSGMKSWTLAP